MTPRIPLFRELVRHEATVSSSLSLSESVLTFHSGISVRTPHENMKLGVMIKAPRRVLLLPLPPCTLGPWLGKLLQLVGQ